MSRQPKSWDVDAAFEAWWHKVVMKDGTVLSNAMTERKKEAARSGWHAAVETWSEEIIRRWSEDIRRRVNEGIGECK